MKNLPRYKKCFICGKENPIGLKITFQTDGQRVYATFKPDEKYIGYKDRIHGGIAASVLDEIMGWSCSVKTKKLYYTVELTVKYKNPIPPNTKLFAEAKMVEEKHSLSYAEATLKDINGKQFALAKGKYFPLSDKDEEETFKLLHHEPEDSEPVTKDDI